MFLDTFTEGDAKALCAWRYFPPDHEYDMPDWDTICREQWALADPTRRAAEFHALREDSGALAGFFRLVPAADAVTLGMGLRPDLCGKGLGAQLVAEACACCARLYPSLSLRLEVRAWNQRAIRCYQAAGFREYATLSRTTPAGQREFLELRRSGAAESLDALLTQFPRRKHPREKRAFRLWLVRQLTQAGYRPKEERTGILRGTNVVLGDPEGASLLLTAHYDTCTASGIPNWIAPTHRLATLIYQVLRKGLMLAPAWALLPLLRWLGVSRFWTLAAGCGSLLLLGLFQLFGPANPSNRNDNTSGVAVVLETLLALSPTQRSKVCAVFFDQEEYGSLGSAGFRRRHPLVKAPLLNFDCVADGDQVFLMGSARVRQDAVLMARLESAFTCVPRKQVCFPAHAFYPSDHMGFRLGIGVAAFQQSRLFGAVLRRIHTGRDRICDWENLRLLCRGNLRLIALLGRRQADTAR